jgi:hypothetical protein
MKVPQRVTFASQCVATLVSTCTLYIYFLVDIHVHISLHSRLCRHFELPDDADF